ncbi:hypothetical protein HK100_011457 [Physocladia obscura]|uniref:Uncharacterized protein n=1 Tax=Physocladia obscura TaxID=109957 RepID=A0AAD5T8J4_9FUNG|nr:hypothetical protein HK100_011457 [Physocladia obscura]
MPVPGNKTGKERLPGLGTSVAAATQTPLAAAKYKKKGWESWVTIFSEARNLALADGFVPKEQEMATKGVMRIAYSSRTQTELQARRSANNDGSSGDESANNPGEVDATAAPPQRILLQDIINPNHNSNHNHNHNHATAAATLTVASTNDIDNVLQAGAASTTAVHHVRRSHSRLNLNINLNLNQRFRSQTTPPPSTATVSTSISTPAPSTSTTPLTPINTNNSSTNTTTALSRVAASLRRAVSASAASFSSTSTSVADIKFASTTATTTPSPPSSSPQSRQQNLQQMISDFNLDPLVEQLDDNAIEDLYSNISTFTANRDNNSSICVFDHVQVYRAVLALDASSDAAINLTSTTTAVASTSTPTVTSPIPASTLLSTDSHLAPLLAIDVFNKHNNNPSSTHQNIRPLGRNRAALSLCSMNLVHLSPNIGFFAKNIVDLELCCNNLHILPPEIGHLRNLTKLNISRNKLQTLPTTIAYCTKLRHLECTDNNIFLLPNSIGALTNLHTLNLARNTDTLTHLPQQIGLCVNLQELVLSENTHVQYLPVELFRLKTLHRLVLEGCDGLLGDDALDDFAEAIEAQVYNSPTLKELAARALHRNQRSKILKHMQPQLKTYLQLGKVTVCSFCTGPIFEYEIERWRRIVKDGNILIAQERLCWRHWDTEQERIIEMFNGRAWTAPRSTVAENGGSAVTEQRPFTLLARKSSLALNNFAAAAASRLSIDHYRATPLPSSNSNPNAASALSQSLPITMSQGQLSMPNSDHPNLSPPTGSNNERSSFLSSLSSFRKNFQLSQQTSASSLNLRGPNRQPSVRNWAATSLDFSSDDQRQQHEQQQQQEPHQNFFQRMLPVDSVNHHELSHRYYAENNDFDDYDDNESMFELVPLHQNDSGVTAAGSGGDASGVGGVLPALVNRQALTIAQIKAMRQQHIAQLQQIQQQQLQSHGGRSQKGGCGTSGSNGGGLRPAQSVASFFGTPSPHLSHFPSERC